MQSTAINVKQDKKTLSLNSDHTQISFTQEAQGLMLTSLTKTGGKNYLKKPTLLWKIQMTNRNKNHADLSQESLSYSVNQIDNHIQLSWSEVPVTNSGDSVTVNVLLTFQKNKQVHWEIQVKDVPEDWSVFQVDFPPLDLAVEKSDDYHFIVPCDRGVVYTNPLKTIPSGGIYDKKQIRHRPYPSYMTMQFLALQGPDNDLLYFGAHDPSPHLKTFYFEPVADESLIRIQPYVPTQIKYGADYNSFPWVTMCTTGDWYDVAQIYRKFALTASWTQRGPLEAGNKTPLWYQNTPMVTLRMHRGAGYNTEDLIEEQKFLNTPIVTHYYMWHQNAFDVDNPYFFPTVPGFRQAIKKLQQHDVHVMPYINPYSADIAVPEWEHGLKSSAMQMNEKGDLSLLTWSQGHTFAGMCPSAPMWRRIISLLAMRMYEMGIKGLYFDEVPVSSPRPCYDDNHGHTPGGGPTYIEAYYDYFKDIRDEAGEFTPDLIMTGEGCGEPHMLYMDAFLIGNGNDPMAVPLFEAVYHDFTMGFGRYTFTPELVDPKFSGAIISKHAQQFIWGSQFGWSRVPLIAIIKKDPKTANFLKNLAHTWINNADYLARGKMLRPLDLSDQLKPVKRKWARVWNDDVGTDVELMPILNSIWQIDDGSIGIVLVNITEKPINIKIKLPNIQSLIADMMENGTTFRPEDIPDSSQYYPLAQNTIGMLRIMEDEELVSTVCDGDSEHGYEVTVPPLKATVIVIGSEKTYGVHN